MKVKELYNSFEKRDEYWSFLVYFDGMQNNVLAFCNASYDVNKTNLNDPYSVEDLFEHEVVSFYPCMDGVHVKINTWDGMKLP